MTPQEWNEQEVPQGATRHRLSVETGCRLFYTDTQAWNGFAWQDVGNTHAYTSLLSEPPCLKTTRARSYSGALVRTKWSDE